MPKSMKVISEPEYSKRVAVCELWGTDLAKKLLLKYGGADYLDEVAKRQSKVTEFLDNL